MSNTTLYVDREEAREAWTRGTGQHYRRGLGIDCRKEFGQKVKESIHRGEKDVVEWWLQTERQRRVTVVKGVLGLLRASPTWL